MKCKICSSEAHIQHIGKSRDIYWVCLVCYLIFKDDSLFVCRQEERKRYLMHNNTLENKGYTMMLDALYNNHLAPLIKDDSMILDFGSGPVPVFAELLKEHNLAVDIYDPYFAPAKDYIQKKYNLITLIEVIEHIKQPIPVLTELLTCLAPSGIILLMTLFSPDTLLEFEKGWYRQDVTHVCFYSVKTFEYIASLFNLEIIENNNKNVCVLQKI